MTAPSGRKQAGPRPASARLGVAAAQVTAGALLAAVLVIGATACGGDSAADRAAARAERQAQANWRSGLVQWSNDMIQALNGLSLLFSSADATTLLLRRDEGTTARLERLATTLDGCRTQVTRLGPAPEPFATARRYALRACASLENGSLLVRTGVVAWQNGLGMDKINQGTDLLGTGQAALVRARSELNGSAAR
jgi:hypothetical protein